MSWFFRCCVGLIGLVDSDTLHAVLRLCLRCTRTFSLSQLFVQYGGVDKLLVLTQRSQFTGFINLCTLIIRHTLEDQHTLSLLLEKVVRDAAAGIGSHFYGVSSNAMGSREVHYVLRQLGPAMCRSAELSKTVMERLMQISLSNGKGMYISDGSIIPFTITLVSIYMYMEYLTLKK